MRQLLRRAGELNRTGRERGPGSEHKHASYRDGGALEAIAATQIPLECPYWPALLRRPASRRADSQRSTAGSGEERLGDFHRRVSKRDEQDPISPSSTLRDPADPARADRGLAGQSPRRLVAARRPRISLAATWLAAARTDISVRRRGIQRLLRSFEPGGVNALAGRAAQTNRRAASRQRQPFWRSGPGRSDAGAANRAETVPSATRSVSIRSMKSPEVDRQDPRASRRDHDDRLYCLRKAESAYPPRQRRSSGNLRRQSDKSEWTTWQIAARFITRCGYGYTHPRARTDRRRGGQRRANTTPRRQPRPRDGPDRDVGQQWISTGRG